MYNQKLAFFAFICLLAAAVACITTGHWVFGVVFVFAAFCTLGNFA